MAAPPAAVTPPEFAPPPAAVPPTGAVPPTTQQTEPDVPAWVVLVEEAPADAPPLELLQDSVFVQSVACSEQPRPLKTSKQQSVVLAGAFIGVTVSVYELGSLAVAV